MCLKVRLDVFCDQAYILIIYTCIRAYVCACEVHLVTAGGHNLSFTSLAAAPCPSLVCSSNIVARCVSLVDRNCSHLSAMRFLLLQRTFPPPCPQPPHHIASPLRHRPISPLALQPPSSPTLNSHPLACVASKSSPRRPPPLLLSRNQTCHPHPPPTCGQAEMMGDEGWDSMSVFKGCTASCSDHSIDLFSAVWLVGSPMTRR